MNPEEISEAELDSLSELIHEAPVRAERCDRCHFWDRLQPGDAFEGEEWENDEGEIVLGECRRLPPYVANAELAKARRRLDREPIVLTRLPLSVIARAGVSPITCDVHWCGEFAAKPPALPPGPARSEADRKPAEPNVPVAS